MKKEYTQSEMEQILRNDAEIPESVDRRMKETYAKLGLGLTAFAAARALNVTVKEENGKAVQQVSVEPTKKEAHKIEVTAGYVPEGYVYQEEGPHTGKYHNDATDGGMTIPENTIMTQRTAA